MKIGGIYKFCGNRGKCTMHDLEGVDADGYTNRRVLSDEALEVAIT